MNKDLLFNENVNLVWHVVNNTMSLHKTKDMDMDDYFQIGAMGLIKAIDTFDSSKGFQFSTYATKCITNEIGKHFQDQRAARRKINSMTLSYNVTTMVGDDSEVEFIDIIEDAKSTRGYTDAIRTTLSEAIKTLAKDEYLFFKTHYLEARLTDGIFKEREYTIDKLGLSSVGEFKAIDRKVRIKIAKAMGVDYDPSRRATGGIVDSLLN